MRLARKISVLEEDMHDALRIWAECIATIKGNLNRGTIRSDDDDDLRKHLERWESNWGYLNERHKERSL